MSIQTIEFQPEEPEDESTALPLSELALGWWKYFSRHRLRLWIVLGACVFETGFYWAVPLAFRHLVDETLAEGNQQMLMVILAALGTGALAATGSALLRGRLYAHLQGQVSSDLRFELFHQLFRLPAAYYSRVGRAEILSRFSNDLAALENGLTMNIVWGILPALDCVVGTVVLFVLDWRLGLVAVLIWPWCLYLPGRLAPRAATTSYERKRGEADILDAVEQAISGQAVLRAYGLQAPLLRDFLIRDGKLFSSSVRNHFQVAIMDQAASSGILLLQVVTLGLGAWMAFQGQMTIGTLAAFQSLYLSVGNSLLYASQYSRSLLPARAAMRRVMELLAEPLETEEQDGAIQFRGFHEAIEFRDIVVRYGERTVLDRICLRIPKGIQAAIVGPSGSGKTTLLELLLRFKEPDQGAVLVDGVDLGAIRRAGWLERLGVVFQDSFLFQLTLGENIRLGKPGSTQEAAEWAARAAGVHDSILRMPMGYDTPAGSYGSRLSGGERQRIAIARALVRRPEILLLDEATSALDPETEAAVSSTLRTLAEGRTTISVTHRLTTARTADVIYVLDEGRLVAAGGHGELLAAGGIYARLWRKQMAGGGEESVEAESRGD